MPVIYAPKQDMFKTGAEVLVNTINCIGVMGKGVALQFRQRYGDALMVDYRRLCNRGYFQPGRCKFFKMGIESIDKKNVTPDNIYAILMFATKDHWRDPSKLEWIETGLQDMRKIIELRQLETVAMPWPGCGAGGLKREEVKPLIDKYLGDLACEVTICG